MNILYLMTIFSLLGINCSYGDYFAETNSLPSDVVLRQAIVGNWKLDSQEIKCNATYYSDGVFESKLTWAPTNFIKSWTYVAKWRIVHGILLLIVTNSDGSKPREPIGNVDKYTIVSIGKQTLIYTNESEKFIFHR